LKCERFDKLIHLFLDGRLEKDEESELREHLTTCEECARKLALLRSMEAAAKKISAEEPPKEYWDTFSGRVGERIVQRAERSFGFGLKEALQGIFSFSPLKIKVATGLISVVLVFIVGKLYVDYRGQEMIPGRAIIQTEEQPHLDVTKVEEKGEISEAEYRDGAAPPPEEPKREKKAVDVEEARKKAPPPTVRVVEEEKPTEELGALTAPEAAEERGVPTSTPGVTDQAVVEAQIPSKHPVRSPEAEQTGAGAREEIGRVREEASTAEKEKIAESSDILAKGDADRPVKSSVDLPAPTSFRPYVPNDVYQLNEVTVPRMRDGDTLRSVDQLKKAIQVWKAYIDQNPDDSLANEGLLQMATAYYLLAKLSQDTTVISEGANLIKGYLDQAAQPEFREELSHILKKISALKEK
jgi:hypothetical protein